MNRTNALSRRLAPALVAAAVLFAGSATASDTAAPDTAGAVADAMGGTTSADDRPGVGRTPAFVCLRTTLTDQGHTKGTRVIRASGNRMSDQQATRVLNKMKIQDTPGVPHVEREVNALVKIYGTGAFAHRFFELDEELPEICSAAPWERKRK